MTTIPSPEDRFGRAEALLAAWNQRQESGTREPFAELLARHPDLSLELRELGAAMGALDGVLASGRAQVEDDRRKVEQLLSQLGDGTNARRYRIEGEVGRGGMGAVLRVHDVQLGRPLAMKVILGQAAAERTGETPEVPARSLQRFLNEARITSQLQHPSIVPVHDMGRDAEGRAYFTMKLVQGRTLADVFDLVAAKDPQWPPTRVLTLIQRVCEALAYAHEQGVVHRDLKPANIMVGDFGEVYVMDWGLARRTGERSTEAPVDDAANDEALSAQLTFTREGAIVGTPAYMPPEQASGRLAEIGPHSDVYSVGAMLYELLAGHAPFFGPGQEWTAKALLARIQHGPAAKVEHGDAPPELVAICERAMAWDRRQRYAGVGELAADLGAFLEGRVVRAYATGTWAELRKWVHRNRAVAGAMLAVAATLLGATLVSGIYAREANANAVAASDSLQEATRQTLLAEKSAKAALDDQVKAERAARTARLQTLRTLRLQGQWHDALQVAEDLLRDSVSADERATLLETKMLGLQVENDAAWTDVMGELSTLGGAGRLPIDTRVKVAFYQAIRNSNPAKTKRQFGELIATHELSPAASSLCKAMVTDSLSEARDHLRDTLSDNGYALLASDLLPAIALALGDVRLIEELGLRAGMLDPGDIGPKLLTILAQALRGRKIDPGLLPEHSELLEAYTDLAKLRATFTAKAYAICLAPEEDHAAELVTIMMEWITKTQRMIEHLSANRTLGLGFGAGVPCLAAFFQRAVAVILAGDDAPARLRALDTFVAENPCQWAFQERSVTHGMLWFDTGAADHLRMSLDDAWSAFRSQENLLPLQAFAMTQTITVASQILQQDGFDEQLRRDAAERLDAVVEAMLPSLREHPEMYGWVYNKTEIARAMNSRWLVLSRWLQHSPEDPDALLALARSDFLRGAYDSALRITGDLEKRDLRGRTHDVLVQLRDACAVKVKEAAAQQGK
ncbi:MAG TPA: serine/threonine-protein kinase [Planctomycetota bacterium]|nr:serine/threonine-protein kinase [Planctomycetota bacterium]